MDSKQARQEFAEIIQTLGWTIQAFRRRPTHEQAKGGAEVKSAEIWQKLVELQREM